LAVIHQPMQTHQAIARAKYCSAPSHGQGPSMSATGFIAAQQEQMGRSLTDCIKEGSNAKRRCARCERSSFGAKTGLMYIGYSILRWNDFKQNLKGESGASTLFTLERWILRRLQALKCVCSVLHKSGGIFRLYKLGIGFEINTRFCLSPIEPDFGMEGSLAV